MATDQYGSPAAQAGSAVRAALLQRAMMMRQSEQDALAKQKILADIELTRQQRDTQAASEQSLSAERAAKATADAEVTNTNKIKNLKEATYPGMDMTPETETALRETGNGHLIIPSKTVGGKNTFLGFASQLETKRQREALQELVDDPDTPNGARVEALFKLAGTSVPAGVAVEKPVSKPLVRSNTHTGAVEQFVNGQWVPNTGPVPADAHFFTFSPPDAAATGAAAQRATDSRYDRAASSAVAAIDKSRQPVSDQMSRGRRLIDTLSGPAGPGDAVAVPEFLTVMAGGFGSGLRMSEAEIARIFKSQGMYDQFKAAVSKWTSTGDPKDPDGLPILVQPAMRAAMKQMGETLLTRASSLVDLYDEYEQKINEADTPKEVGRLRAEMRKRVSDVLKKSETGEGDTKAPTSGLVIERGSPAKK